MDEIFSSGLSECPYCHSMLSHVGETCQYCGGDLTKYNKNDRNQPRTTTIENKCPDCGYIYQDGETVCPICNRGYSQSLNIDSDEHRQTNSQKIVTEKRTETYVYAQQKRNNESDDLASAYRKTTIRENGTTLYTNTDVEGTTYHRTYDMPTRNVNRQNPFVNTNNGTNDKNKMPTILKVILIIFGIQFIFPILIVILGIIGGILSGGW